MSDHKGIESNKDILYNYIYESLDILDRIEKKLIYFEKSPDKKEHILQAYRDIHTFKSNSLFFGFNDLENKSMIIENIFDEIKNDKKKIDTALITFILKELEYMRKKISNILSENFSQNKDIKKRIKLNNIENINEDHLKNTVPVKNDNSIYKNEKNRKDIRVDTEKLDKLFDLVGEIITSGSMITNNPIIKNIDDHNLNKSLNLFNKITKELQEITMSLRMIPLDGLFTKMVKIVRELSIKSDKKINFSFSGEETEMDRNLIEEISDPIVHLIRNAIDHGIESPENRLKLGKSEVGNISLSAKYEGQEIIITVNDDGAGLDRDKILNKAIELNIINGTSNINDNEIFQLIFESGFSTAEKVTEISGRGLGMDIVKKSVDKLKGKILIDTHRDIGTSFIIRIPLTLAIMEGIIVKVGENFYCFPLNDILEFYKPQKNDAIKITENNEIIMIRDENLPLIKLYKHFNIETKIRDILDGIIIVIQNSEKRAAVLIDEIIGSQQLVLKTLSDHLGIVKYLYGYSIFGNGEVALIIDSKELLNNILE